MSDESPFILILRRLEAVLRRNDYPGHANYVAAIATLAEWDRTTIGPALASGAMWGGSGSVFDIDQFESADDKQSFLRLLLQLAEAMENQGIDSPSACARAEIISQWLDD